MILFFIVLQVYFKCNGAVVPNKRQSFKSSTHENTGAPIVSYLLYHFLFHYDYDNYLYVLANSVFF